jgi:K+-sensing histidine kinase KdpD
LDFTPLFIKDVRPRLSFSYWPTAGITYAPFLLMFIGLTVYAHVLMYKHYRSLSGYERNQIKYVFLGTAIGFLGGTTNYPLWYDIPVLPIGNVLVAVYVFLMAYAIVKYRLLDIRLALTRAGIFTTVYMIVLGIPLWMGYKYNLWQFATYLMLVLATSGPFMYIYFKRKAEDRILKKQRRAQHVLIERFESITLIRDLEKLLKLIVRAVTMVLKVDYAAVFLLDKRNKQYKLSSQRGRLSKLTDFVIDKDNPLSNYIQEHRIPLIYEELKLKSANLNSHNTIDVSVLMKKLQAQVIIPSFIKDDLLGFVVLGNKTTGEIYSEDDLITLSRMANYSALALEYAQFLKEYEEAQAKLREAEKLKGIAQLMHSLNHELLNLFNKMSMPIQLIMMGDVMPNDKANFDSTLKSINDAMETSIEILGYITSYRNKSGSQELKPVKIEESIDGAINRFSKRFKEANIQVLKAIPSNLPPIQVKDTFNDLIVNILANSYFALIDKSKGDRLIDIQVKLSNDKSALQIKMSDTGPDMTGSTYMSDKDSPFKERGKIGGVNFGLAHLITNQHDGTLTVESYEKGGTRFVITLPIAGGS